jgi:hypothetical protein
MAVIYYSGHGMEIGGENWLIPVDAELQSDRDAENEAIALSGCERIEPRLVILDGPGAHSSPTAISAPRGSNRMHSALRRTAIPRLSRISSTAADTSSSSRAISRDAFGTDN